MSLKRIVLRYIIVTLFVASSSAMQLLRAVVPYALSYSTLLFAQMIAVVSILGLFQIIPGVNWAPSWPRPSPRTPSIPSGGGRFHPPSS
ncbi:hypothetical protein [Thermococcus sp. 21S7]|uniref:hypothetical protein n=1 Tax=Thermococcus sp. 21S7 TaxID=1638221 RepID=UPI00143A1003|nr:hypothetical protein [Thermococcus sp. 21S7]NJE62486.1 hypothetical protein [Thermococcus sp. 21S7]